VAPDGTTRFCSGWTDASYVKYEDVKEDNTVTTHFFNQWS